MELSTGRLLIRSWREDDIAPYAAIVAKPEVMRHIGDGSTRTAEEAARFVRGVIARGRDRGWILWAVEERASGQLIGFCGFAEYGAAVEIGWRLDSDRWGRGYGTEAARAALAHGLQTYRFPYVCSIAQVGNLASIRIMEKIGLSFEREGTDESCGRPIVIYSRRFG